MKVLKIIVGSVVLLSIVLLGNSRLGMMPPVMKFVDPFHGFWQNATFSNTLETIQINGTDSDAEVILDERGVPHVFATNEHDLYYLQGYMTAKDRLWQMEFQTHAAAGRLSEVIGDKAISFDLEQRRIGMTYAADQALELIAQDSISMLILKAYCDGVNQFISSLDESSLPLEYKLLDYKPEPWTIYKSCLLLKYMAKMLTGTENDRANTEAMKLLGPELFWKLYPDQTYLVDPIVPGFLLDTASLAENEVQAFEGSATYSTSYVQPHFVGSNNWAVSGTRTESGNAILCNDPHLRLSLPSIWYEIQLNAPGINCYGVSLPGSPGVTIGFNERVAWGVTNAGRDVKDYYSIDLKGDFYQIGDSTYTVEPRVESIKVRGGQTIIDTVLYTVYGPIAHVSEEGNDRLALRWLAHDPSNELKTFYELNRASNFDDYSNALEQYNCPGQNFVYADVDNNIAIWQQGKFRIKPKGYGKFILNGSDAENLQEQFIPKAQNPHMLNPARGFVSSANQAAVDSTYPYYVSGVYEEFRNRTINRFLRNDSSITIEDMRDLQLSNYNLLAEEALPLLLELLDTSSFQYKEYETLALNELLEWNYRNDKGLIAPTVFEIWWDEFNNLLWDEFNQQHWDQDLYYQYSWEQLALNGKAKIDMRDERYVYPMNKIAIDLLKNHPENIMFDHHSTNDRIEIAKDIVYDSFYWTAMKFGEIIKYKFSAPHWGRYQGTRVQHLLRIDALSSDKLFVGGSEHAPNATTATHGPSWRMIVELDKDGPIAYGVLPGGQSGNAGSDKFIYSLNNWVNGEYHRLHFIKNSSETQDGWQKIDIRVLAK
ncbi:MAG: penicillin acylase family protein [Flavobacteriales bacterium]|nr:penicillin acylase family protein [Flavobacteriales bacterium]